MTMTNLRKRSAWGIGAVIALILGTVTAASASAPTEPSAVAEPAGSVATMTEGTYLVTIRGLLSAREHENQTNAEYTQGGQDICADIDAGATWDTFAQQIDNLGGGDYAFYRAAIAAAVNTYCPEHADILP